MKFREDFIGTGTMKNFTSEANLLFSAINNISFVMPSNYSGVEPTVEITENGIIFDFGEALIFTLNNIDWNFSGTATFGAHSASVVNGQLVINVTANK